MAISNKIEYATIDDLCLDPLNPRLGRSNKGPKVSQQDVLELMRGWSLEELAVSFLESGFWVQEALLVVEERLYNKKRLVVVEGNRQLAALIYLRDSIQGNSPSKRWAKI